MKSSLLTHPHQTGSPGPSRPQQLASPVDASLQHPSQSSPRRTLSSAAGGSHPPAESHVPQATAVPPELHPSDSARSEAIRVGRFQTSWKATISRVLSFAKADKPIIFVKGLKKCSTPESVALAFAAHGEVLFVQLPFDKKKKRNVGYSYVVFDRHEDVRRLLASESQVDIDGKLLPISCFLLRSPKQRAERGPAAKPHNKRQLFPSVVDQNSNLSSRSYSSRSPMHSERRAGSQSRLAMAGMHPSAGESRKTREERSFDENWNLSAVSFRSHAVLVERNHHQDNICYRGALPRRL